MHMAKCITTVFEMKDIASHRRERIIALHLHTTKSQREIARDVGVSQNCVGLIIRNYQATGSSATKRKGNCGRKRKLTKRDAKFIVRESRKNPRFSARQVQAAAGEVASNIGLRTMQRVLKEEGRKVYRAIKVPNLNAIKCKARLAWATVHHNLHIDFWSKVSCILMSTDFCKC